jgi:hypothetical protein
MSGEFDILGHLGRFLGKTFKDIFCRDMNETQHRELRMTGLNEAVGPLLTRVNPVQRSKKKLLMRTLVLKHVFGAVSAEQQAELLPLVRALLNDIEQPQGRGVADRLGQFFNPDENARQNNLRQAIVEKLFGANMTSDEQDEILRKLRALFAEPTTAQGNAQERQAATELHALFDHHGNNPEELNEQLTQLSPAIAQLLNIEPQVDPDLEAELKALYHEPTRRAHQANQQRAAQPEQEADAPQQEPEEEAADSNIFRQMRMFFSEAARDFGQLFEEEQPEAAPEQVPQRQRNNGRRVRFAGQ